MNINKLNLNTQKTEFPINISNNNQNQINDQDIYTKEEKVPEEGQKKKWLVILYSAGDNNLAQYLFEDINELESVGSDVNTHILTIADQGNQYNAAFKGAKNFYLKKDNDMNKINSPLIKEFRPSQYS